MRSDITLLKACCAVTSHSTKTCLIYCLRDLFHPAFLARAVSWFTFVVAIFMGHFQIYSFSLAFSNSSVFTAEQCERKAETEKFYVNGA